MLPISILVVGGILSVVIFSFVGDWEKAREDSLQGIGEFFKFLVIFVACIVVTAFIMVTFFN